MGRELECRLRYANRTLAGKAYLETDHVLFRGEERLKIQLKTLTGVQTAGGVLRLEFEGGPAEFELGKAVEKWAEKILHPPSRLDKLGVKSGATVKLVGDFDDDFRQELREANSEISEGLGKSDLIVFATSATRDLARLEELATGIKPEGALWVVYRKGVAPIRELDVLQAGRAAGLKDTKVAGCWFSLKWTAGALR